MIPILQTQRLSLRELTFDDADFIFQLLNSEGWLRFIGQRNIKTIEDAKNYIAQSAMKSYHENGFGLYLVELIDDKTAVGLCGLLKRDYLDAPDIGYAYLPQFWGKGYAVEAASAIKDYAFNELKFTKLQAITSIENAMSQKVLTKIGLNYQLTTTFPLFNEPSMLFETMK